VDATIADIEEECGGSSSTSTSSTSGSGTRISISSGSGTSILVVVVVVSALPGVMHGQVHALGLTGVLGPRQYLHEVATLIIL
jgi:hypothetical protein